MLPAFIIEQIRRREKKSIQDQPQLELPLPPSLPPPEPIDPEADRGVFILDLM